MKSIEEIKKTPNLVIKAEADNDGIGGYYYDRFNNKKLNFIFSYQMGWEHLSVSMPSKTPSILIGFRNEAEKQAFLLYAKKNNIEINKWKFTK